MYTLRCFHDGSSVPTKFSFLSNSTLSHCSGAYIIFHGMGGKGWGGVGEVICIPVQMEFTMPVVSVSSHKQQCQRLAQAVGYVMCYSFAPELQNHVISLGEFNCRILVVEWIMKT